MAAQALVSSGATTPAALSPQLGSAGSPAAAGAGRRGAAADGWEELAASQARLGTEIGLADRVRALEAELAGARARHRELEAALDAQMLLGASAAGEGAGAGAAPRAGGAAGDAPAQEAARWLQRAADGGHVLAKYQLATMLAQGEGGVAVDTRRAHALFQAWERECAAQAAREEAALEEAALEAAAPAEPADDGALDAAAAAAGGVQVRAGPGAEGGSGRGGGRGGELLDVTNVARRSLGARESEGGGDELGLKVQALRARIARVSGLGAA